MNKIKGIAKESLKEDYAFIKRLENKNKDLEKDIWSKFCNYLNEDDEEEEERKSAVFKLHPRRIHSDSECSRYENGSGQSTPRKLNVCNVHSSPKRLENVETLTTINRLSSINLAPNEFVSTADDLVATEYSRRKLRSKLTKLYGLENEARSPDIVGDSNRKRHPLSTSSVATRKKINKPNEKAVPPLKSLRNNSKQQKMKRVTRCGCSAKVTKKESLPHSQRSDMSQGALNTKLKSIIHKCINHITDIRTQIETGIEDDGEEDLPRRMKRMQEYSSRFSRTYLYPLARHLDDLCNMKSDNPSIAPKMVGAFHVVQQALHSYNCHLPSSGGNCASDKMKSLLKHSLDVCSSYCMLADEELMEDQRGHFEAFRHHVELLQEDIEYNFNSNHLAKPKCKENKGNDKFTRTKLSYYPSKKKSKPINRLNMYNVSASFRRDVEWKKTVDLITKKRYDVKSRYKTATYKHRPPVEKVDPNAEKKSIFPPRRSSSCLRNTPIRTPVKEDDIETMVQVQREQENRLTAESSTVEQTNNEVHQQKEVTWDEKLQDVSDASLAIAMNTTP